MSTYTTYYHLDKYEGTDRPNLRDQYSAAMDKVDNALHTQEGNISSNSTAITTLQTTQTTQAGQIATLQSDVSTAQSTATSASTTATSAASTAATAAGNATQALTQLNDAHFYHIQNDQLNTTWSKSTWPTKVCSFNAMVVFDDDTEHGLLFGSFYAESNSTTSANAWQQLGLVSLSDWTIDSQEGHDDYCTINVINGSWGAGLSIARMTGNLIYWTPVVGVSGNLPAGEAITGQVMFPVKRRSV